VEARAACRPLTHSLSRALALSPTLQLSAVLSAFAVAVLSSPVFLSLALYLGVTCSLALEHVPRSNARMPHARTHASPSVHTQLPFVVRSVRAQACMSCVHLSHMPARELSLHLAIASGPACEVLHGGPPCSAARCKVLFFPPSCSLVRHNSISRVLYRSLKLFGPEAPAVQGCIRSI
jgi:hypothetical protein